MLHSIQAGRGLAAVFVLLFHLSGIVFGNPKYFPTRPFGAIFDGGHSGVDFFFVLSGFIIMHAHRRDIGRPESCGQYIARRLTRIYPVYWVVLAAWAPLYLAVPGRAVDVADVVGSVLLLPSGGRMILDPAWTLCHEVTFYGAFLVLIVAPRVGAALFALWGAAIVLAWPALSDLPTALRVLLSPFNLLFPIGIGAALVLRSGVRLPAGPLLALGASAFLACGLIEPYAGREGAGLFWRLGYGMSAAAAIIGAARLELAGRIATPAVLFALGEASYSIYLTHFPTMLLFAKLTAGAAAPDWLMFLLIGGATLGIGVAFHLLVEKPMLLWMKGRRSAVS